MILFIGLLLLFAFFTAASEMAFVGCNWVKLKHQADKQKQRRMGPKLALNLLHKQDNFLNTVLVVNNLTLIMISLIAREYWHNRFSDGIIVLFCTIAIFIFGEILPKSFISSSRFKEKFFVIITPIYIVLYWIFYPLIFVAYQSSTAILRLLRSHYSPLRKKFTKEEFRMAAKKFFSIREQGFIMRLLEFEDKTARDIMIPYKQIQAAKSDCDIEELKQIAVETGYSRIPMYKTSMDDIIGYIKVRDLLITNDIKAIIRECKFITETKQINELFDELNLNKPNLIIVKDEKGKVTGMITIEDIIEELFGEIEDEYEKIG